MNKDLLNIISSSMNGFSKGQKAIANYIINHYDKAAFMTASKLGVTVGVSESTVVRFATEMVTRATRNFNVHCKSLYATVLLLYSEWKLRTTK